MTNRLERWIDWLHASPVATDPTSPNINDTTSTKEGPVPTTTAVRNTPARIAQLRAELDAINDEATTDPLEHALVLDEWQHREMERNQRRLQITAELRRREELGGLADDPAVLASVASYVSRTSEDRAALAPVGRSRVWPPKGSDSRSTMRLTRWYAALEDLSAQLPDGDDDADSYIEAQLKSWFSAQLGVAHARLSADGTDLPQPELTQLPRGYSFGLHRA